MREKIEQLIDDFTREIVQTTAQWGKDTPPDYYPRHKEVEEILKRFIKDYIEIIFQFDGVR